MGFHKTSSGKQAVRAERASVTARLLVPVTLVALVVLAIAWLIRTNTEDSRNEVHVTGTVVSVHMDTAASGPLVEWTGTARYTDRDGVTHTDGVDFVNFVHVGDRVELRYRPGHPDDAYLTNDANGYVIYAIGLGIVALVIALFAVPHAVRLARLARVSKSLRLPPTSALFDWYPNRNAGRSRERATLGSLQAEDRVSWGPLTVPLGGSPPIDQAPTYPVLVYGNLRAGPVVIVNEHWTFVATV